METYFLLTWISAARPPIHPNPMKGVHSFSSAYDAGIFFSKLNSDAKFVSLVMIEEKHTDISCLVEAFLNENKS
jgi:hypothetical protein